MDPADGREPPGSGKPLPGFGDVVEAARRGARQGTIHGSPAASFTADLVTNPVPGREPPTEDPSREPPAPSELPYRADMERSFGRPLGHVQAYTGMAAELAPYGAQALSTRNVVTFADAKPPPALVAHEVTHTVQNEQASAAAPMGSGRVAPRHSAAELEADRMAARVAAAGPGIQLPPVIAAPAADVQLAPTQGDAAHEATSSAGSPPPSGSHAQSVGAGPGAELDAATHPTTAAGAGERSAIDRAIDLTRLATAHLGVIESTLVPAYRRAVAAMDAPAVKALAQQIVGGVARIVDAQAHIVKLVPQVETGPQAARVSTAEADPGPPDELKLDTLTATKATLDALILVRIPQIAGQVSPQWFGEELVAGSAPEALPRVHEVLAQLTYEAGLVVQLLEEADTIQALVQPVNAKQHTSEQATDVARADAVGHLERWKSRPINFLFLARVLSARGVWQSMQGIENSDGNTAEDLEKKVTAQSKETGTTADVGDLWDPDKARRALSYSTFDWRITDADAQKVFDMLAKAEPRARAGLVKQLDRMGRLGRLCEHLPWGMVKQLWESIFDSEAEQLLLPYWVNKGGGSSLGKWLKDQGHWYTDFANKFLDVATLGAKPRIDAAYDAREAGLISDNAYWDSVAKTVGRTGLVMAAMAATGGTAGAFVEGASEGLGIASASWVGEGVTAVAAGAVEGGVGNVAGHFIGDVYDQVLDGKRGFDSLSSYADSFGEGAVLGSVMSTAGLAASKFIPKTMRTIAQEAAAAHPEMTRLFEAARRIGQKSGTKVRMKVEDFLDRFGGGGPPGFRLAYATAGGGPVPSKIASAPPGATVLVTIRPLQDLNAPMQMQGGHDDLIELQDVELSDGEVIAGWFDEFTSGDGYTHAEGADFTGETSKLGESGPEVGHLRVSPTHRRAGVVAEEGQVHTDQHHVFPQERRTWFTERNIDIDEYCIDLTPWEHQAQHGGGNSRLARRVARQIPEAEWNAEIMDRLDHEEHILQDMVGNPDLMLTEEEAVVIARQFMTERGIGDLPFRRYTGGR